MAFQVVDCLASAREASRDLIGRSVEQSPTIPGKVESGGNDEACQAAERVRLENMNSSSAGESFHTSWL